MVDPSVFPLALPIVGSVTGGIVGGFAGFVASLVQDRAVRRARRRAIASALIGEIGALMQLYHEHYVDHLKSYSGNPGAPLCGDHPLRGEQEYMPIFRSLGSEIGSLPAPLPHDLVMWYTALTVGLERAHALYDLALRNNNEADLAFLARMAQDQINELSNLSRRSEELISRLADL